MTETPEHILFNRVVDRTDGDDDWQRLDRIAATDPELWRRLAEWLRDDALVRAATAASLDVGDRVAVELPRPSARIGSTALGWLAAALLGGAWLGTALLAGSPAASDRLVGELPRVLVEAELTADGERLRVVTLRRLLEESVVSSAYWIGESATRERALELASLATPKDY
jgi:hypothetical protein